MFESLNVIYLVFIKLEERVQDLLLFPFRSGNTEDQRLESARQITLLVSLGSLAQIQVGVPPETVDLQGSVQSKSSQQQTHHRSPSPQDVLAPDS